MQKTNSWKPTKLSYGRYFFTLFIYYFLFTLILPRLVAFIQLNEGLPLTEGILIKYQVIVYLFSFLLCAIVLFPLLKNEFTFDFKRIIISIVMVISLGILFNIIFNLIVSWINGEHITSNNQQGLNNLAIQNKWLFLSISILLAPALEELVFRGTIFRSLREKYSFWFPALISSVLFGLMHVLSSILAGNMIDVIYLFLYSGLGFIFCVIYEYNRTIYACIIVHMLYNLYASLGIIFS